MFFRTVPVGALAIALCCLCRPASAQSPASINPGFQDTGPAAARAKRHEASERGRRKAAKPARPSARTPAPANRLDRFRHPG